MTTSAAVRALLVSDLVGSTRLVEELGDSRAARIMARHDEVARKLLDLHQGVEVDKTDGFLLLFERPINAVWYSMDYHQALERMSDEFGVELRARVGIHLGEVILRRNPEEHVARGAKPLEVEGLAKPTAARLMSLALGGQTLLTRGAYEVAQRSTVGATMALNRPVQWVEHGGYSFKGVSETIYVYEVGVEGKAPMSAPEPTEKVSRVAVAAAVEARKAAEQAAKSAAEARALGAAAVEQRRKSGGAGAWLGVAVVLALLAGAAAWFSGLLPIPALSGVGEPPAPAAEAASPTDEPPTDEPPTDEPPTDEPAATEPAATEPAATEPAVSEAVSSPATTAAVSLVADWRDRLAAHLSSHRACRAAGADCAATTALAIESLWGVKMRDDSGLVLDLARIQQQLEAGAPWAVIGLATDQAALQRAGQLAEEGRPVIAVGSASTVNVALILPGAFRPSSQWGREVPMSAAFFTWDPSRAFVERSLSFAFSDPEGVLLYQYVAN